MYKFTKLPLNKFINFFIKKVILNEAQGYNMNISKLITFIFKNKTIFWDIPKWNRGQTKWDGGSNSFEI